MSTIFIIHGSDGYPGENWFPWLKNELELIGQNVCVPQFQVPTTASAPGGHRLDAWKKTLQEYATYIDEQTIFVGHSRGCIFIYRLMESLQVPVKGAFLVAPWIQYRWYPKGQTEVDSFHKDPFDWEKMKKGSRHIEVFQSTNDDTPIEEGKEIAAKLEATYIQVELAGHFNVAYSPSFTQFPLLLERIKLIL